MRIPSLIAAAALLVPGLVAAQVQLRPPMPQRTAAQPAPAPPAGAKPAPAAPPPAAPKPGDAGGSAKADSKCVPMTGRLVLAFNKADIIDVLEQVSRWTCRNFLFTEDNVRGKITLISRSPVTAEEAYAAFLAALSANNITIYPTGRYYKLVRLPDAKKTPIPLLLDDGTEVPGTEQPITKVIRLRYADADQLKGILGNFTSPQGADLQSVPPDILIATDLALNLKRIERLVDEIDKPGQGDIIRVIQVQYAAAKDLADKINQIFTPGPAQPGKPAGKRPLLGGGMSPPPVPAPVAGAPADKKPGESDEVSLTKLIPDERTNKLIVIASEKSFTRLQEIVAALDVPTSGGGGINVVFLKNANAEDMSQTLQALAQGQASARKTTGGAPGAPAVPGGGSHGAAELFSGEVKITADKASNALLVLANSADYQTIQRLIDKLDRPRRQVFVEAVIMEVNLKNENKFGVSMHGALPVTTSEGKGFIPLGSETGRVNSLDLTSLIKLGGFLTGVVGPVSAQLKDLFPFPSFSLLMQAIQSNSDVNVLSTPHLLTSDNEEAEITVGQNVPFQAGFNPGISLPGTTGTTGTTGIPGINPLGFGGLGSLFAPIQRQNVELKLKLKPQINEGEMIRLEIEEQTEEIASNDDRLGPTTAKRTAKTKIVAKDQSTVVIGGLIQERTVQSITKVPILGDVPILGWLFRDKSTTKFKTNLLLFLTPYIIRDQADFRRIFERKLRERQDFVEQFYGRQPGYEVPVDYGRKAGPYSKIHRAVTAETMKVENGGPGAPGEKTINADPKPSDLPVPPSDRPTHAPPPTAPAPPAPSDSPRAGPGGAAVPMPTLPPERLDVRPDGR